GRDGHDRRRGAGRGRAGRRGGRIGAGAAGDDADAVELALRALARRDHSAAELDERLERSGCSEADRRNAVDRLAAAGYVDDMRYAAGRAELLAERGYGDEAIRLDLERRGIDREQVEHTLSSLPEEQERARGIAAALGDATRA